jgi:Ran-binding protein 9/10
MATFRLPQNRVNWSWHSLIGLGVCCKHASLNFSPGEGSSSWAYHGNDGCLYAESRSGTQYGETFGTGDIIGCQISPADGVIFTKNGISLGNTQKGTPLLCAKAYMTAGIAFPNLSGKLYPFVSMRSHGGHIRANFGKEPFRYSGDAK